MIDVIQMQFCYFEITVWHHEICDENIMNPRRNQHVSGYHIKQFISWFRILNVKFVNIEQHGLKPPHS